MPMLSFHEVLHFHLMLETCVYVHGTVRIREVCVITCLMMLLTQGNGKP